MKYNIFLLIFVYDMQYTIKVMVHIKIVKKILYKSCFLDLERIEIIFIISNGKNCFGFGTNHFSNSFLERIIFDNRELTVFA